MTARHRSEAPTKVTPGLARLAALFSADVRARATPYFGDSVDVLNDDAGELSAAVMGTEKYLAVFERAAQGKLHYGCSCPFFQDRLEGCKHLWALAVTRSTSRLVSDAANCSRFVARAELAFDLVEGDGDGDEPSNDDEDFDDDDDDDYFEGEDEESAESPLSALLIQSLTAHTKAESDWRALSDARATRTPSPVELVYLLGRVSSRRGLYYHRDQGATEPTLEVVLATRPAGARDSVGLKPAQHVAPLALTDPEDRELFGLLRGARSTSSFEYSHVVRLEGWLASDILSRLARSGRCHVMPLDFELGNDQSWLNLRIGTSPQGKRAKTLGIDYDQFTRWPVLGTTATDRFELELELVPKPKTKVQDARYALEARLVRGAERVSTDEITHVDPAGRALRGAELIELEPADAHWLARLKQHPHVTISADELQDFTAEVFGHTGVSRLALPAGYTFVTHESPPEKVLELGAPGPKATTAELRFAYGSTHVNASDPSRLVFLPNREVLARDQAFESNVLRELQELGFEGVRLTRDSDFQARRGTKRAALKVASSRLLPTIHALFAAGFQVYGEGKRYRSLASFDVGVESGLDWFEVKGSARFVGSNAEVPFPKLLRALRESRNLVPLSDGTHGVLPDDWAKRWGALADVSGALAGKDEMMRFSQRQLGILELLANAIPEASGSQALSDLRDRLDSFRNVQPRLAPSGFRGDLRAYQSIGLGWLDTVTDLGFGACLADDMGLGKTVQVLAHLFTLHRAKSKPSSRAAEKRCSLVVVPRSLLGNWTEEAARFAPELRVHVHWGPQRGAPGDAWDALPERPDVILTTYGTLRLDAVALSKLEFETVVLDEAQAIKNEQSSSARASKLLRARQRIAMSGTPIENHVGELWSLFDFLNPGLLKELPGLKHAVQGPRPSAASCELIRRAVRPFILRRTKAEVAPELPDRVEQTLYVELEKGERAHYDELLQHYRASLGRKVKQLGPERATPHVLEALLRLRQAACHPGLVDRERSRESSAKVELLLEQLRSLRAEGHQALIFSQFTSLLDIVRLRLEQEGVRFEYLDGKTRDRAACVERFQSDPEISAFLISLKAGGVGLNLTAADYVFILDPWWNPASEAQAIDRAHRIGQTRNVIAYRLLARNTVEERVAELQRQKRDLVASVMGDGALSTKLTREDLEALLDLA